MNLIPQNADFDDPRWECEFLNLAHGLVTAGAKTKLIARFTGVSPRKIRSLYAILRGASAPAGPIVQAQAQFFAIRSTRISAAWNIQCAIFLACFERVAVITEQSLQRGWHLLAAFKTYLSITDPLKNSLATKRLDINQAYALLTYCGFLEEANAELQRRECPVCLINFLVVMSQPVKSQRCPMCFLNQNNRRLVQQGQNSAHKGDRRGK